MNSEGFTFIGIGIMILCICHGCSSCERTNTELDIQKAKARVEMPEIKFSR